MSEKFQLPSALFIDTNLAPFPIELEEGQGFAVVKYVRKDEVVFEVDVPGVTVAVPNKHPFAACKVGDVVLFSLEGEYLALKPAPAPEKPVATGKKRGTGSSAQGCDRMKNCAGNTY